MNKNLRLELLSDKIDFAIEQLSFPETNFNTNRNHYHSHYEILYVHDGNKNFSVNNIQTHMLDESCIALVPPNVFHTAVGNHINSHKRFLINYSIDFIKNLSEALLYDLSICFNAHFITLSVADKGIIKFLINSLYELKSDESDYHGKAMILSSHLLMYLSELSKSQEKSPTKIDNPVKIAKDYIHENYFANITLDMLSEVSFCSKPTITTLFNKAFGVTPHKYLLEVRINNAKRILSNPKIKIIDCATLCGFDNVTTFNRAFKNIVGISPKQFQIEYGINT